MSTAVIARPLSAYRSVKPPVQSRHTVRRSVQRTGAALLNQQCWLWGCDVRRDSGNALVHRGFSRMRPPCNHDRSTQYTLSEQGFVVRLWGSGIYAGSDTEGVFLNRFLFEPRCARHQAEAWQDPAMLKRGPQHWDHALLARLCRWIGEYETWAACEFGLGFRRVCLDCFKESVSGAEEIATAWHDLATLLYNASAPTLPMRPACSTQATTALNPVTAIAGC